MDKHSRLRLVLQHLGCEARRRRPRCGRLPQAVILHRRVRDPPGASVVDRQIPVRLLNFAWHRLDAWPDVPTGLTRLKRGYVIAPVSNGNISLMVDLARRNGFPWDAILGAEIAGDYKPKPRVYLAAAEAVDLKPEACMMVAAHSSDLAAAAKLGLRTAHVARPNEHGPGRGEAAPTIAVDLAVKSLEELAAKLGV